MILVFKGRDRRNFPASDAVRSRLYHPSDVYDDGMLFMAASLKQGSEDEPGTSLGSVTLRPRKLWTRSGSQDAAAKYRLHYAPYYPRLHSAFEGRLLGRGPRGGGSKIQEIPP